jgi:hypothetical protein
MQLVGGQPGRIYSGDEVAAGKVSPGQRLSVRDPNSGGDKEYVLCCVAAAQNLTLGTVVTIDGSFVVTVAAVATANTAHNQLGVVVTPTTSGTASASAYIWVQTFGRTLVRASTSVLPAVGLKIGTTAGIVTDTAAASASAAINGIVLTATSNTSDSLTAAILTYPSYGTTFAV